MSAEIVHSGRLTQVWDAKMTRDNGKLLALFRRTQMISVSAPDSEVASG